MTDTIKDKFRQVFNAEPALTLRSPGRVNLIGEHTDYNGGYVLPAAIDRAICFSVSPRADNVCRFIAHDLEEEFTVLLGEWRRADAFFWANYLMGVLDELQKTVGTNRLRGMNLVFGGDLPSGGGVSSSAAIENGIGFAANELFGLGLSRMDLLKISQRAENNFVGMQCGIMDMFAAMMGRENMVIRLDCRSLEYRYFPFEAPNLSLVLCDTGVKHQLVNSEYNTRRAECEEGVSALRQFDLAVSSLRDVSLDFLKKHKNDLRPVVFKRCKYVVEEIARVEKACVALEKNDFKTFGKLMFQTHDGLNLEYEVSCPELNFLVELARTDSAVLGARMMGGGFGGCTINLLKTDALEQFVADTSAAYERVFGRKMPAYPLRLADGTGLVV